MTNQYLIKKSILLFWKMYLSLSNNFFSVGWFGHKYFRKSFTFINFVIIGIVCWLDFVSFLLFLHKLWTCKDKDCARNDVTKLGFNKRSLSLLLIFIYDDRWRHFGTECNLTPQNSLSASTSFNSGLRSICSRVKSPISDTFPKHINSPLNQIASEPLRERVLGRHFEHFALFSLRCSEWLQ